MGGKFYWFCDEDEERGRGLASLIKYNDGAFKSVAQYKLMYERFRYTSTDDRAEIYKMYGIMLEDRQWMITTSAFYCINTKYIHSTDIPIVTMFVMDGFGVVAKVKRGVEEKREYKDKNGKNRHKYYMYDISKNELKWKREWDFKDKMKHTDYHKEMIAEENKRLNKIDAKNAKSDYIGDKKERIEFTAEVVKQIWIDNDWGGTIMNIMITPDDNKIIWYQSAGTITSLHEEDNYELRGTVKKHEVYNGCKQTIVNRCKMIKELEGACS